jgi:hypothetical protein
MFVLLLLLFLNKNVGMGSGDFICGGRVEEWSDGDQVGAVRNEATSEADAGVGAQVALEVIAVHLKRKGQGGWFHYSKLEIIFI